MALSIKHPEADRLARELAAATGESLTEAVVVALRERLQRQQRRRGSSERLRKLQALQDSMRALPVLDDRGHDEMLYDEHGAPR